MVLPERVQLRLKRAERSSGALTQGRPASQRCSLWRSVTCSVSRLLSSKRILHVQEDGLRHKGGASLIRGLKKCLPIKKFRCRWTYLPRN